MQSVLISLKDNVCKRNYCVIVGCYIMASITKIDGTSNLSTQTSEGGGGWTDRKQNVRKCRGIFIKIIKHQRLCVSQFTQTDYTALRHNRVFMGINLKKALQTFVFVRKIRPFLCTCMSHCNIALSEGGNSFRAFWKGFPSLRQPTSCLLPPFSYSKQSFVCFSE